MAKKPASIPNLDISGGQKIYFASDFHLGAPNKDSSLARELKIVRWLDQISDDAKAIFLVGDIFDFWFEYKHTIPKGFIRFQGKLAELRDRDVPIYFFTGNHDMWMFSYFTKELGIPVFTSPVSLEIGNRNVLVGHGDGLGKGDHFYKFLRKIFRNKFCQWLFALLPSSFGMGLAMLWSKKSRDGSDGKEDPSKGDKEPLLQHARKIERSNHHDYYIFGHRHLPLTLEVSANSTYFSLGEWMNDCTYLEIDEKEARLRAFDN